MIKIRSRFIFLIIENNWNIGSLMSYYNNIDFTFKTKTPEDYDVIFLNDKIGLFRVSGVLSPSGRVAVLFVE